MRHGKLNKRFGRNNAQRKQLMRSLTRAVVKSYRIETTIDKAKEAKRYVERLITLAKKKTLADIRSIDRVLQDRQLTKNLIEKIAPLFAQRQGGYTRVIRTGFRRGDGAQLAILELVEMPVSAEKKPKKEKKPKAEAQTDQPAEKPKEEKPRPEKPRPEKHKAEKPKEEKPKEEKPRKTEEPVHEKEAPREEKQAPKKGGLFGKFKGFFKKGE